MALIDNSSANHASYTAFKAKRDVMIIVYKATNTKYKAFKDLDSTTMTSVSTSVTCDLSAANLTGVNSPTSSGAISYADCKAECLAKGRWSGTDTEFKLMDKAISTTNTKVCLGVSWTTSGTVC